MGVHTHSLSHTHTHTHTHARTHTHAHIHTRKLYAHSYTGYIHMVRSDLSRYMQTIIVVVINFSHAYTVMQLHNYKCTIITQSDQWSQWTDRRAQCRVVWSQWLWGQCVHYWRVGVWPVPAVQEYRCSWVSAFYNVATYITDPVKCQ